MMLRPDTMTDAATVLGHHLGGVDPAAIQLAFGTALRFRLKDRTLRDEFTQIVDRYARVFEEADMPSEAAAIDPKPPRPGKTLLKAEYYNPLFEAGELSFRSFRVLNTGADVLATVEISPSTSPTGWKIPTAPRPRGSAPASPFRVCLVTS